MSGAPPSTTRQIFSHFKHRKPDGTEVDPQLGARVFADVFSGSEPSKADQAALGVKGRSEVQKPAASKKQADAPTKASPTKASPGRRVRSGLGGPAATSQRTLLGN